MLKRLAKPSRGSRLAPLGMGIPAGASGRGVATGASPSSASRWFSQATSSSASGMPPPVPPFDPVEVEKPQTDYRQYRFARLRNNLQVMVVSDSKCDRAAAALSVQVGSLFDPPTIPGLAHFCEHMLFLGTKKFPAEGEYNEFLAKNGGGSNAYTAESLTNYFFSIKPEALGGALDRFSQFFVAPLFTESATERELQAVDSEHSKNLQQDSWRLSQLMRNSVNPEHPLNHFMTGNSETLRDTPAKTGINVREALLKFHEDYYSANLMKLVIVGREEPEELLQMAMDRFSEVQDRGVSVPKDEDIGRGQVAFGPGQLGKTVHVVPVQDVRIAAFQFVLPGQRRLWRSKPSHYVSHLIGHEGEGSLLTALKERGLATELSAGLALDEAGVSVFSVSVHLTEKGEGDVSTVGNLLFSYIRLLQEVGPQAWVFHELQQLSEIGFRFRSLQDAVATASTLAHNLQEDFPVAQALSGPSRLWDYEPRQISELLGFLRCENLRLILQSKAYADRCTEAERWYGTRFHEAPLEDKLRARWERPSAASELGIAVPKPNPFIPEDLNLRPQIGELHPATPQRLALGELSNVATAFFRKDEDFGLPKALCAFQLYCPFSYANTRNRALAELWCLAVQEELNEFAYEAHVTGLNYSLAAVSTGINLSVGGYNDKLPILLRAVAAKMRQLNTVPEQTYGVARTILERSLVNAAARSPPYQQGMMEERCFLLKPAVSYQERLDALRQVGGAADLTNVARSLLGNCHVECLLQGNLTEVEAAQLVQSFVEPLQIERPLAELPPAGSARLPSGWTLLERAGTDPNERNSAVTVLLQVAGHTMQNHCLIVLAAQVLGQRFYDELRTRQQLGYIVSASPYSEHFGYVGLRLLVQSERSPSEVLTRIREWIDGAWRFLAEELTEESLQEYRAALVALLRERPKSLTEEFGYHWGEVLTRGFEFQRREAEARHLEQIRLDELQRFAREQISVAPAAAVLIAANGTSHDPALPADRRFSPEDVADFRSTAEWRFRSCVIDPGTKSKL